jgi:hypothetical protein
MALGGKGGGTRFTAADIALSSVLLALIIVSLYIASFFPTLDLTL